MKEQARRHLLPFIQWTKPDYVADRFHEEVCRVVEQFHRDVVAKKSPRVIIVAHPQSGKTEIVSRRYPAFALGRNPELCFIGCSYNQDWANDNCRQVQQIMESDEYRETFPVFIPDRSRGRRTNAKRVEDYFEIESAFQCTNPGCKWVARVESKDKIIFCPRCSQQSVKLISHNGRYKAVGRGGGATGRPAHIVLIDDPFKDAAEAMSETIRAAAWEWYTQALRTRVQRGGGILIMATRWHSDDLIGKVIALAEQQKDLEDKDDWVVHHYPALSPEGGSDWRPTKNLPCAPSRYDTKALLAIQSTLSAAAWSALYDGSPVALEGNILPGDKWKYYGGPGQPGLPDLGQFDSIIQTWDGSFKDSMGADFCAGQTWGIRGAERWMLDYILEKMSYSRFKQAVREMRYRWPDTGYVLIEDKANGPAVINELKGEISGIREVDPAGGKIARAWSASADLCAGNCFIPDPCIAHFIGAFVNRCAMFPANINKAGSDDDIDAWTQMINFVRRRMHPLVSFWLEQAKEAKAGQSTSTRGAIPAENKLSLADAQKQNITGDDFMSKYFSRKGQKATATATAAGAVGAANGTSGAPAEAGVGDMASESAIEMDRRPQFMQPNTSKLEPTVVPAMTVEDAIVANQEEAAAEGAERETDFGKVNRSPMAKPLVNPNTPTCPQCGNKYLSRYSGLVKCNGCGWEQRT